MTKPFSPRELVARVRTVLRRTRPEANAGGGAVIGVGDLQVDPMRHLVFMRDRPIECTPAEFKILSRLIETPGRAFTRQRLLEEAFGFDHYALDRTIDVHIMNLRKKLEDDPSAPAYLLTVYGVGYKLTDQMPIMEPRNA